ncbi:hypothetical protein RJG79_08695 [Mycoplasmatota bacterium WC44]
MNNNLIGVTGIIKDVYQRIENAERCVVLKKDCSEKEFYLNMVEKQMFSALRHAYKQLINESNELGSILFMRTSFEHLFVRMRLVEDDYYYRNIFSDPEQNISIKKNMRSMKKRISYKVEESEKNQIEVIFEMFSESYYRLSRLIHPNIEKQAFYAMSEEMKEFDIYLTFIDCCLMYILLSEIILIEYENKIPTTRVDRYENINKLFMLYIDELKLSSPIHPKLKSYEIVMKNKKLRKRLINQGKEIFQDFKSHKQ